MKKLVLAFCAVLVIGCCLMAGGWAAGGRLYSSFYNGVLHPVTQSLYDTSNFVRGRLYYHTWWLDDDWFFDDWDDRIEDFVKYNLHSVRNGLEPNQPFGHP